MQYKRLDGWRMHHHMREFSSSICNTVAATAIASAAAAAAAVAPPQVLTHTLTQICANALGRSFTHMARRRQRLGPENVLAKSRLFVCKIASSVWRISSTVCVRLSVCSPHSRFSSCVCVCVRRFGGFGLWRALADSHLYCAYERMSALLIQARQLAERR